MESTILHIGYPKTATTWFQKLFYPSVSNISFVNRSDVFEKLIFLDTLAFNAEEAKLWFSTLAGNKRLVICDEILLGGLDIGFGNGEFVQLIAERLQQVFPNPQVVIFIRNQHTALESAYSHYIMSGGTYSVKRFLGIKQVLGKPFMGYHLFNPKLFEYNRVINLYASTFGKSNLHVFLYEDFSANPKIFIDRYCSLMRLESPKDIVIDRYNVRLSALMLQKQRILNRFSYGNTPFKQYFFNIHGLYKLSRRFTETIDNHFKLPAFRFTPEIHEWIENRYRASNRSLTEWITPEQLTRWGYPL